MNYDVRTILLFTLLLSGAGAAGAQSFEVPNIEYPNDLCELRAENRAFVHAPLGTREKLLKELREHSDLLIVERPEEADFLLLFTYTPFYDGSADGQPPDVGGGMAARAELAAVKFVARDAGQVRPRILFYWSAQKSFRGVQLPLSGLSANGFVRPRSGRGAAAELIGRLALWAAHKRWPRALYFDQFTNQLTIASGGKLEDKAVKAFLKELKKARGDDYARRCVPRLPPPPVALSVPERRAPLAKLPGPSPEARRPPVEARPVTRHVRGRSPKRGRRPRACRRRARCDPPSRKHFRRESRAQRIPVGVFEDPLLI